MKGQVHATKFVNLCRFSVPSSSHCSSISRFNHFTLTTNYSKLKFAYMRTVPKAKNLELSLSHRAFVFLSPLNVAANYLRNFRVSGTYICSGSILGVSIASAPIIAHAMDVSVLSTVFSVYFLSITKAFYLQQVAGDALVNDHESQGLSEEEETVHHLWRLARKFWLPVLFFLTVLTNLDDSITILFIKLTLFLVSTKPNPFSVYVYVDQLCQQSRRQETQIFKVKSLYASKVEVQDYRLLCLAAVEVRDQKFTLVGILGNWWALPHLPFWEAFSSVRNRLRSILVKTT
ncbi:hypothetical protein CR513_34452 [Mucuna pruriens]|uniref:Uncharacterized protein n=1 Tax=Mucuna pruriens TaxID=157652 RepID=A0A371G1P6_MUCPR|nr:hypothetical protein CR513_34452 [Mucuna pruriens]